MILFHAKTGHTKSSVCLIKKKRLLEICQGFILNLLKPTDEILGGIHFAHYHNLQKRVKLLMF